MDQRVSDSVMREGEPDSLSDAELQLDREPLTRTPAPRPVRAWVRYGEVPLMVEAVAVAWTEYAVAIKWPAPGGGEHRAWVWASAVRGG
jgi:hypothetical protein